MTNNGTNGPGWAITTKWTAWATTGYSMPEADPGIAITSSTTDQDGYRQDDGSWWAVSEGLPDDWGKSEDDPTDLDKRAADAELSRLGWRRVGEWIDSGGQWGADVESVRA